MSDKNFMSYEDAEEVLTEYAGAIKENRFKEITYEQWLGMTEEERETGKYLVSDVPNADGKVSIEGMVKLWENPNETASAGWPIGASGEISIPESANYDMLLIRSRLSITDTATITTIITEPNRRNYAEFVTAASKLSYRSYSWNNNKTTIYMQEAGYAMLNATSPAGTSDPTQVVPVVIYGIKLNHQLEITAIARDVSTSADKCVMPDGITPVSDAIETLDLFKGNHYVDITADFDSGVFSAHPERYQAGNYIKKTYHDVNYVAVLADYNTYYNPGRSDYANINVPHWTAIVFGFPAGQINSTDTTAGGFSGSAAFTWLTGDCTTILQSAFGAGHLKGHKCLLSNGTYNASAAPNYGFSWAWTTNDIYAMFMSEIQMHGSKVLSFCWQSSGEAVKQLEIFKNESFMSVLGRDYGAVYASEQVGDDCHDEQHCDHG